MKSWHGITSEPPTDIGGAPLAIFRCSKSIGEDGFLIWVTVLFLWRDETRLQKPFRETWQICLGGLKTNQGYIFEFYKILYLFLGKFGMIKLASPKQSYMSLQNSQMYPRLVFRPPRQICHVSLKGFRRRISSRHKKRTVTQIEKLSSPMYSKHRNISRGSPPTSVGG